MTKVKGDIILSKLSGYMIAIGISSTIRQGGQDSWSSLYYYLKSGAIWYRRERNTAGGYFILWYSEDAGVSWEELMSLDLTEPDVVIDLTHVYRHRIVGTAYHIDQTLTPTGYSGIEGTDWENIYST
jgi:hypothetical protein